MERIVLIRKFAEDITEEKIAYLSSDPTGCLKTYRVRGIRSYVGADKRTLVCIFDAPDAEAVRSVANSPGVVDIEVFPANEHVSE